MNETLTRAEIETRFDSEWILIADPETDEHLNVTRGKVVAHSQDRDEIDRKAVEFRLKHSAFLYTGPPAESVIVSLYLLASP